MWWGAGAYKRTDAAVSLGGSTSALGYRSYEFVLLIGARFTGRRSAVVRDAWCNQGASAGARWQDSECGVSVLSPIRETQSRSGP